MKVRDREWQIGLFGTFDVENYGDLLFPLIAEAELTERLGKVNLHRFSYHAKTPPDWPYEVASVADLPRMVGSLDGVLIGGGFIVRFDKFIADGYGPPTPSIHHPTGYWLTPALIALQHDIPVIWNAPGMHCNETPAWADPLMELALSLSRYVAVRDEPSRAALANFSAQAEIAVVPDTAFGISRLLGGAARCESNRLRDASGLTEPYIVIQAAQGLDSFVAFVKKHSDRLRGFRFLALPIGPVLGDDAAILDADLPGLIRLPYWPQPLVLAELISQAVAVVGHSYHLAITALASGVPVFTPADISVGKYSALSGYDRLFSLPERDPDLDLFLGRLGKTAASPAIRKARDQLTQHWDRVAAALEVGAPDTRTAINGFWQSLPGLLENAAAREEAAINELKVHSAELQHQIAEQAAKQRRIDELTKLLALARTEITARDDRLSALRNSPSWKVTAPARFFMRQLKRLVLK